MPTVGVSSGLRPTASTVQGQTEQGPQVGGSAGAAGALSLGNHHESPAEQAAAALVDISGASKLTVDGFEASIPPNLATASRLVDELAAAGSVSTAAFGSLYTLMDSITTLTLTGD